MKRIGSFALILVFGALFVYALIDGNRTGIISTGLTLMVVCFVQAFVLVPALRRWNERTRP